MKSHPPDDIPPADILAQMRESVVLPEDIKDKAVVSLRAKGRHEQIEDHADTAVVVAKKGDHEDKPGNKLDDPFFFPVDVYAMKIVGLPDSPIIGAKFCGRALPTITPSPVTIGVLGDTGLRVKTTNDG